MFQFYNPNPVANRTDDCAVRAVAKALNISWEEAFALIAAMAYNMGEMMHKNAVWGAVLRQNGFYRYVVPNECPDCYTAEDFIRDNPSGIFVLGFDNHVATIVDGVLYDTFDSTEEIPIYFWTNERMD